MNPKRHAEACEQNRLPILGVLKPRLKEAASLLEIGSGTGQHAAYFAPELPHLAWHTSDLPDLHQSIRLWIEEAGCANLRQPIALDVTCPEQWPTGPFNAAFSANTAHILPPDAVEAMFLGVGRLLPPGAPFLLYGPFMYHGEYTSESNWRFDRWIRAFEAHRGVRDVVWLRQLRPRRPAPGLGY
ncbi:MAG: DUF938 domain-containing protein [Candidatus Sedimenticola endophacoides]